MGPGDREPCQVITDQLRGPGQAPCLLSLVFVIFKMRRYLLNIVPGKMSCE